MLHSILTASLFAGSVLAGRPWSGQGGNGPPAWSHGPPAYGKPACAANNLEVQAPSGTYRGIVNATAPQVRQFLSIPFAKPPQGDLRFLPPQPLDSNASTIYDASRFPPSCAQYVSPVPDIFNQAVPEFLINGNHRSEDCLYLAVWTPAEAKNLPVIMYITGGAFTTGGVEINYQLPYHWVQRTQSHIVVTINYRLNIFGFPDADGLEEQNLGILDQRMALEWVRDNIEAFGGDPNKITLWGQSAGGSSVDYHNFAFYNNPIVSGFFAMSGSVGLGITTSGIRGADFSTVANELGCSDPPSRLSCMRALPWQNISAVAGKLNDAREVGFYPVPDEKIIFSNYTERYIQKKFTHKPAIFSTCENEGNVVAQFNPEGVNQTVAYQATLDTFLCPAAEAGRRRTEAGVRTYRSLYAGNFSNVSPLPWMGAYHDSDLPLLFGTDGDFRGESMGFEREVSEIMQDYLLAFMNDPYHGLDEMGWPDVRSGEMVVFARGGEAVRRVGLESVQGVCKGGRGLRRRDGRGWW